MITAYYALPLVALYIFLSVHVVKFRKAHHVSIGDGGHEDLALRMRTHGNWSEYAPLGLIVLALAELSGVWPLLVHLCGLALLAGRALHAWGLGFGGPLGARVAGMALTFLTLALASLAAVIASL